MEVVTFVEHISFDARRLIRTDFYRYVFRYRISIEYASSNDMAYGDYLSDYRHSNY